MSPTVGIVAAMSGEPDDLPMQFDGEADAPEESETHHSPGHAGRGKGRGKGRKNPGRAGRGSDPTGGTVGRIGRPSAVKAGFKTCSECQVDKELVHFKPGNAICNWPCYRVKENIYKACKADNLLEWYNEQRKCPNKWKKLKRWYRMQCGADKPDSAAKCKSFPPLQYQTAVRAEQQQIRDGIRTMMHVAAFCHWASKSKNWPPRGLTPEEAKQEFNRMVEAPDTIVD